MNGDLQTDRDAFNAFLDGRYGPVPTGGTLEAALTEFRAYQRELERARAKIREAKAASQRENAIELDIEQLVQDVNRQLSSEGIQD